MSCKDPHVAFEENKTRKIKHRDEHILTRATHTHTSTNPCIHINTNTFIDCVSNV